MKKVLVTGASGFVGTELCAVLSRSGYRVVAAVRCSDSTCHESAMKIGNIDANTQWKDALHDVDVVVHLASRVHVMTETAEDPMAEFRRVNVAGTENLAKQCLEAGVKRFIFLSSIKVNGEKTDGTPFRSDHIPQPHDDYAFSKWEAECLLRTIEQDSSMELVVIRPPLVYGPGVKGNFFRLLKIARSGVPLPLKRITNLRSMVSLANLCDFIQICIHHSDAAGGTFLVADGKDMSTPELISKIAANMQKQARLFSVPEGVIRFGSTVLGRPEIADRLCDSLQIEIESLSKIPGWVPPFSVDEGLQQTVFHFLLNNDPSRME